MAQLDHLEAMGFPRELAGRALTMTNGDLEKAAGLLVQPDAAARLTNPLPASHNQTLRANLVPNNQTMRPDQHHQPPRAPDHAAPTRPLPPPDQPPYHQATLPKRADPAPGRPDMQTMNSKAAKQPAREASSDHAMPQAPLDPRSFPAPRGPEVLTEPLQKRMFVDVRDTLGKWLEAEVVELVNGFPKVHYLGWDAKWDETIESSERIASCHKYSSKASCEEYEKGSKVFVWVHKPVTQKAWVSGMVNKVDGQQLQVEYYYGEKKYQYWYHAHTDEIRAINRENSSENKTPVVVLPELTNGTYFQGQFLEVRDNVTWTWRAAEVRRLKPETNEILIHYDGFAASWDEYLHVEKDVARIKPLGADIPDTPEIATAKREDEEFREGLKSKGMTVVDVERDGNCLFRSVAHQMYNDVTRHAEVRKLCYDYMLQDTEFFSCFIPEDFAKYVAKQQKQNEWGDHPEVIALREIFNVNVEVYDKAHFPSPLYVASTEGLGCIMRLTFHGHNHYNSLVGKDYTPPLLPLAQTGKVNLKQLRLNEVKTIDASAPVADAKEDPCLERQNTIRSVFGLGKALKAIPVAREPNITDVEDQVSAAVKKCDRKGYILVKDCTNQIVPECLRALRDAKLQFFKQQNDKVGARTVEAEYDLSAKYQTELALHLCASVMAPNNQMLVLTLGISRNLMTLDQYWGKALN